jgi:hypothetical protein
MATGRDLLTASLRLINAVAPGESIEAQEATDGLASMNRMLSSWSIEGLVINAVTAESPLTLTPGDATVTLGSGGDITARPVEIVRAVIRSGTTDYPLSLLTATEYADLSQKSLQSNYPVALYDDGGYPLRTLTLYPVPSAAYSLVLFTKRALTALTLNDAVSLPDGYERAIVYNGALELAPEYGKAASAEVVKAAMESKAAIKLVNGKAPNLRCDSGLLSGGAGWSTIDFLTGGRS